MNLKNFTVSLLIILFSISVNSQIENEIIAEQIVFKYKINNEVPFDVFLTKVGDDITFAWKQNYNWGGFINIPSQILDTCRYQANYIYGEVYYETVVLDKAITVFCSKRNYNELINTGKTTIEPYFGKGTKPREFLLHEKGEYNVFYNGQNVKLKTLVCSSPSGESYTILDNKDYPLIIKMDLDFSIDLIEVETVTNYFFNRLSDFHIATLEYLKSDSTGTLPLTTRLFEESKISGEMELQVEWGYKLGMTLIQQKKFDEAKKIFFSTIENIDVRKIKDDFLYQKLLGIIASYYSEAGNHRNAIDAYIQLFELEKRSLLKGQIEYAKYLKSLAGKLSGLYKKIDQPDSAKVYSSFIDSLKNFFLEGINNSIQNKNFNSAIRNILSLLKKANVYDDNYNQAIELWQKIPAQESYYTVLEVLRSKKSSKAQKYAAASIMMDAGGKDDVEKIIEIMSKEEDFDVVQSLASFLVQNTGRSSIPIFLKLANNEDATENARFKAIWWLGDMGDKTIVPELLELTNKTNNEHLLFAIAQRLAELGDTRAVPFILNYMKLYPETWQVIWGLENMPPSKEILEMLYERLKNGKDYNVRDESAKTLGAIGDETSIPHLREAMNDENEWVRYYSAAALWRLGDNYGMKYLIAHDMRDDDIDIDDNTATDYVSMTKDATLFDDLKKNLEHKDPKVRQMAIRGMGGIGNPSAIPLLYKIINDKKENENVKAEAIISLVLLREFKMLPQLVNLVNDKTHRWRAAKVLHQFVNNSVKENLQKLFNSNDDEIKEIAAVALSILNDKDAIQFMRDRVLNQKGPFLTRFEKVYPHLQFTNKEILWIIENPSPNWYWEYLRKVLFVNKTEKDFEEIINLLPDSKLNEEIKADILLEYSSACREYGNIAKQVEVANEVLLKAKETDSYRLIVQSLWLIADAEIHSQQFDEANANLKEALKYCNELTSSERWEITNQFPEAFTFCQLGELFLFKKDYKKSVENFNEALKELKLTPTQTVENYQDDFVLLNARISSGLGEALIELGKKSFKEAIDGFEKVEAKGIRERESRNRAYFGLIKAAFSEGNYEEAQRLTEKLSLIKLNEDFEKMDINPLNPERKKEMELLRQKKNEIEEMKRNSENKEDEKKDLMVSSLLQNKQREFKKYINTLKKENPKLFTIMNTEPSNLKELQDAGIIKPKMALIQYLIGDEELYTFIVTQNDLFIKKVLVNKDYLSKLIYKFRTQIKNQVNDDKTSGELYSLLIEPFESNLKGIEYIGIIPNQQLFYLPFAALKKNGNQNYLFEDYKLFFINSTSLLGVIGSNDQKCNLNQASFLAYANADGTLPETETEVKTISTLYNKKETYINDNAKKEKLFSKIGCKILHFATHGVTLAKDPTNSYLVLAPKGEKGRLSVEEIWGLDLKDCPLVILSACETADGELAAGDEVISLAFGFIYAGSSSCLATLWQVESKSTVDMMQDFHKNLKSNLSRVDALQLAMKNIKNKYDNPYYWSQFILIGDWR